MARKRFGRCNSSLRRFTIILWELFVPAVVPVEYRRTVLSCVVECVVIIPPQNLDGGGVYKSFTGYSESVFCVVDIPAVNLIGVAVEVVACANYLRIVYKFDDPSVHCIYPSIA